MKISGILLFSIFLVTALFISPFTSTAQTGAAINMDGSLPDPSAILDVSSTSLGLLAPRMTEADKNAIASPATGLLIYQTDAETGFWYFDGSIWTRSVGPAGPAGTSVNGNAAGDMMYWDGSQWLMVPQGEPGNVLQLNNSGLPVWTNLPPSSGSTGLPATLYTTEASVITISSASIGGYIINQGGTTVTDKGICWSTNPNPTFADEVIWDGTGGGAIGTGLSGLQVNTTYYVRAYATNLSGTTFGNEVSFTTRDGVHALTTSSATQISSTIAICGGAISDDGGTEITGRGICVDTNPNPDISTAQIVTDNFLQYGSQSNLSSWTTSISGLLPSTTYYFRSYASNVVGTTYGNELTFTTAATPQLVVGESYAGGTIFYVDQTGLHGLVAATVDQGSWLAWGCIGTNLPGAAGLAVGTGNQNTIDIEAGCTTPGTPADICSNLVLGGYNDWYLPSKDELYLMLINLHANQLGGFNSYDYWSSSEVNADTAWRMYFINYNFASQAPGWKTNQGYVRAIRAF